MDKLQNQSPLGDLFRSQIMELLRN